MRAKEIREYLDSLPIASSHSHHLPDHEHLNLSLAKLLQNSYVAEKWIGIPTPTCAEEVDTWLERIRNRNFFIYLERALQELYHIRRPLHRDSWEEYDSKLRQANADPDWHLKLLKENCRYESIAVDTSWDPGSNNGHPELFRPAFRINPFTCGYDKDVRDSSGNNAQIIYNTRIDDIEEYVAYMRQKILEKKAQGCTALKCSVAYFRPLDITPATKEQAQKALRYEETQGSPEDIRNFQDYILDTICTISAEIGLPMQIHTGLGQMHRTNAMCLQPLIDRHKETTFILMHGSYPWTDDYTGLVMFYPNVNADICWLPQISPSVAKRTLHELVDVCNADKICWGCDTWTGEESYASRMAMLDVVSTVLAEKIEQGSMDDEFALHFARGLLHENARRLFK